MIAIDDSVVVQTVGGEMSVAELGLTLIHEHVFTDVRQARWSPPADGDDWDGVLEPVHMCMLGKLRQDPYLAVQNCHLDEPDIAVSELGTAAAMGVRTIIDPTCEGIGRFPELLAAVSRRSGVQIIMGSGYYIEPAHPSALRYVSPEMIAEQLVAEATDGVGPLGIRPGIIGEIGVSEDFTDAERKVLRGAAMAYGKLRVPLYVHLPGWHRLGNEVLDLIEAEGGDPSGVVLCHMNPSGDDLAYQIGLAKRGAWLGYDMLGMDFYYGADDLQSPSDEQNVRWIVRILEEVGPGRVLLSSDVFLKMMLRRYGGNGYGYVPGPFAQRLRASGVSEGEITTMLELNPQELFVRARTW